MKYEQFYKAVYSRDNPEGESHGLIQWKGTDVCMDITCKCGHEGHFDGDFLYHYQCPQCHAKYAVGHTVKLIELTPEEGAFIEGGGHVPFKTTDLHDEPQPG